MLLLVYQHLLQNMQTVPGTSRENIADASGTRTSVVGAWRPRCTYGIMKVAQKARRRPRTGPRRRRSTTAPFPAYCVFGRVFEHTNSDFQWNAARGAARA